VIQEVARRAKFLHSSDWVAPAHSPAHGR
jgi:hypothetical protein